MPNISIEGLLSAAPAAEPWPRNELGGDSPLGLQADEMFARQLDTGFAGEVRGLVSDPVTGLAGRDPEGALAGIAETTRLLGALKDRYLAQAIGPRQKALLEPVIDRRLDRARGDLGRIAEQATSVLDDRIVAERLADLRQDAALAWHDPAHLRTLGQPRSRRRGGPDRAATARQAFRRLRARRGQAADDGGHSRPRR